jgi:hypothetical protein
LLDRDVAELGDSARRGVHAHVVLALAYLCCSGRKHQILRVDRVQQIQGRDAFALHQALVHIYHDFALLPSIGKRQHGAGHRDHLWPHEVLSIIVELLLGQVLSREAEL